MDNVYVLCFNIKVSLKGFLSVIPWLGLCLSLNHHVRYLYTDRDYVLCFNLSSVWFFQFLHVVCALSKCFLHVHCMDLGLCSEMLKSIRRLVLLMYIDNVYVLCFNIKVCLKGFSNVTCTGYITYTMIGFMFIFEPSLI